MPNAHNNQVVPGQEEHNVILMAMWVLFTAFALFLGMLMWVYGFRRPQIVEIWILMLLAGYFIFDTVKAMWKRAKERDKHWPKPRLLYSERRDRKFLALAAAQNSTLLGYEDSGKPVFLTDDQRAMQTNIPGVSGAGKSTLLYNILQQDIRRGKAIVFLEGKGEKEFTIKLIAAAIAAGRADDIRLIDPTHPGKSHRYNPFYAPAGDFDQRVGIVFESLGASQAKDEFFAEHQRAFLDSICNILSLTGRTLTFESVLAAALRPDVIRETILNVRDSVLNDPNRKHHEKVAFEANVAILEGVYGEKEWLSKIQGLLNSMKPFVSESMSEITNATENLVTVDDVVEKNLILIVTMNIPKGSAATKTLGRIILRDLQSTIAKRYDEYALDKKHSFVSIVLDEFGLFVYGGFSNIIHTARQANASFIFAFQSINQLAGQVGETFAHDVSTATNCKLLMRISDDDTADYFTKASGSMPTERVSYQVEREAGITGYQETGRGTRTETYETRVKDHHVKALPTGQMMALLPDRQMGVTVKHVHVRRPAEYFMPSFTPKWISEYAVSVAESNKLNIKFTVDDTNRSGKSGRRARKS
jgi:type IV secretory pathway TraG/TraD family ATPase VirD4